MKYIIFELEGVERVAFFEGELRHCELVNPENDRVKVVSAGSFLLGDNGALAIASGSSTLNLPGREADAAVVQRAVRALASSEVPA